MANPIPNADTTAILSSDGSLQEVYASSGGGGGGEVEVTNWPATQDVAGIISVSNFPATQAVSGTISVSNFPTTQAVSGTVTVSSLATAGSTQQGAIANPAYTDETGAANGTMIALLKGLFVQNAQMIALLSEIRDNTAPA